MGEFTTLMARDGHEFNAWLCSPPRSLQKGGGARGALVVAQDIVGVNQHLRRVAENYAAQGYVVIAPCLFDRVRRGIELGYSVRELQEGQGYRLQIAQDKAMRDLGAGLNVVKHAGRVAMLGFGWGGALALLAARELPVVGAVSYYGEPLRDAAGAPRRPVMYHFGEQDPQIPPGDVERIRSADPGGIVHTYPAGHGFDCEGRDTYDAASAELARQRTLAFVAERMESK